MKELDYVTIQGRYLSLVFRLLASTPFIEIIANESYKLRYDIVILGLEVLEKGVDDAIKNEPHGIVVEPTFAKQGIILLLLGPLISLIAANFSMQRQYKNILDKYGGQWPEKIETNATMEQIQILEDIVRGNIESYNGPSL